MFVSYKDKCFERVQPLEIFCIVKSSDKMVIDDQNLRNCSRLGPDFPSGSLGNMTSSFMKLN